MRKIAYLVVFVSMSIAIMYWLYQRPSNYIANLPESATEINEHFDNMFVTFDYAISAKISRDDFIAYTHEMQLLPTKSKRSMGLFNPPKWWPQSFPDDTVYYFKEKGEIFVNSTYLDGRMYLLESK